MIVSNHVPKELLDAQTILLEKGGIEVELIGEHGESYTRITPHLLNKYDIIVSIGKTVQYCLVGGRPVYIYDKFGGPGYLNSDNLERASYYNFSGRGFQKKTAKNIADELIQGYSQALKFTTKHQSSYQQDYLLPTVISEVCSNLKQRRFDIDANYAQYISVAEKIMQEKVILDWKCVNLQNAYDTERKMNQEAQKTLDILNGLNQDLKFQLNNALRFRGARFINKALNLTNKVKLSKRATIAYKKQSRLRVAERYGWHEYKTQDDQLFLIRNSFVTPRSEDITILTRIRDEELLLPDTLRYLSATSPHIFVYDDDSRDKTFKILCKNPSVQLIISNLHWRKTRTAEETRSRKVLLEETKRYSASEWFWYTDADERIIDDNIQDYIKNIPNSVDGVNMRLFDAYMTPQDHNDYLPEQPLEGFRTYFGPEYRDILTFFRNKDYITYSGLDAREPIGPKKTINHFVCQHYGKALSVKQWEDTCKYYMENFEEPYRTKWSNRRGKSIHSESDFGRPLQRWGKELFSSGIKI